VKAFLLLGEKLARIGGEGLEPRCDELARVVGAHLLGDCAGGGEPAFGGLGVVLTVAAGVLEQANCG
jgi:hypothetical protein